MARKSGTRYSTTIYTGYSHQEELERYISLNGIAVPVEILKEGESYIVYYEDANGLPYLPNASGLGLGDGIARINSLGVAPDLEFPSVLQDKSKK